MRMVRSIEWTYVDDADGYLRFQNTRYPEEYLLLKACRYYDVKLGKVRDLVATSSDQRRPVQHTALCSASSN